MTIFEFDARGDRSQVIVYSDSLADNGNISELLGFPGRPYWHGRWSNGPVAVKDVAAILGMPLVDHAYTAATTGLGNLIDGPRRIIDYFYPKPD